MTAEVHSVPEKSIHLVPGNLVHRVPMTEQLHDRIRRARIARGFQTPAEAAAALGWNENTYKSHENGMRVPKNQGTVRKYAWGFKCDFIWLLTGQGSAEGQLYIKVLGRIGAGAEILPDLEQIPPEGLFEIEVKVPISGDAIAFEVEGDSMWPRYDPGDVIICGREGTFIEQIVGWEAAVRTDDGRRFLKKVRRGSRPGLFDLESHNASPIRDVKLEWAAEIDHVIRAGKWRRIDYLSREEFLKKHKEMKRPS